MLDRITPTAIIIAEPATTRDQERLVEITAHAIGRFPLYTPVIACAGIGPIEALPGALPIADESRGRLVARLGSALRVRALHATVMRRASLADGADAVPADLLESDPLDDATVLVAGRGRSYPGLIAAVAERVGLIGALSVETAAHYLNARDIDGVVIGDGFGPPTLGAFLTALSEDARFCELPVALFRPNCRPRLIVRRCPISIVSRGTRMRWSQACSRWCASRPSPRACSASSPLSMRVD